MTDTLLRSGLNWLSSRLDEAAGEQIVYVAGNRTFPMTAVPMNAEADIISADGIGTTIFEVHWVLPTESIDLLTANRITPSAGHRVRFGRFTFDVLPLGDRPCVTPHDQLGIMSQIHTRLSAEKRTAT